MSSLYSPKQIAEQLEISTTTLRRYEDQGLIPEVPRTRGSHRSYLLVHLHAFSAIRALLKGYDIPVVYEAMRSIRRGETERALWLLNRQQYRLQAEKDRVEDVLKMIQGTDFPKRKDTGHTEYRTIREIADIAGVNPSAIRHWEKEGLLQSRRNPENGYRIFTAADLRRVLVISSLRKTVYYIENMKELLDTLDTGSYAQIERSFHLALHHLNLQLMAQYKGVAALMTYIQSFQAGVSDG